MFRSATFTVTGDQRLHCVSCEQRVVRAIKSLAGVQHVRADASSQRIEVMFDPAKLDEPAIAERLGLLGYSTEPVSKGTRPGRQESPRGTE